MSAYAKLRRQRQLFVDAYVRTGVGSDAWLEVNPKAKRPDQQASRLLANPDVATAIKERTEQAIARSGVRLVRVLEEIAAVASFNPQDLRGPDGKLLPVNKLPRHVAAAIAGEEFDDKGNLVRYRTHPKNEANRTLLQYLQALPELHRHTGASGGPIETKETSELSNLDRARRIAYLLHQGMREAAAKPETPLTQIYAPDDEDDEPAPG